jgi:hypothetical protein
LSNRTVLLLLGAVTMLAVVLSSLLPTKGHCAAISQLPQLASEAAKKEEEKVSGILPWLLIESLIGWRKGTETVLVRMTRFSALGDGWMLLLMDCFGSMPRRWSKRKRMRPSWSWEFRGSCFDIDIDADVDVDNEDDVEDDNLCCGWEWLLGFARNEIDVADSIVFIDDDGEDNIIFSIEFNGLGIMQPCSNWLTFDAFSSLLLWCLVFSVGFNCDCTDEVGGNDKWQVKVTGKRIPKRIPEKKFKIK